MPYKLAVCIPARNEMWLSKTVEDVLEHKSPDTEIIVGIDDGWPDPPIKDHKDLTIIHAGQLQGQRGMTKQCARLTKAKFLMKLDAHCSVAQGFDVEMLKTFETLGDNIVAVPLMKNLHCFNWICPEGHRRYQGPSGVCQQCGKETTREVVWIAKNNPQSSSYCFDTTPHFQYFKDYTRRPEYKKDLEESGITETMSLQGSCYMMTKKMYFDFDMDDESMGSWGSQGLTIACKTWLSGGRVVCNHNTWYAHLFRTQGGDFSFPYHNPGSQAQHAKKLASEMFFAKKWDKAIYPMSWLVSRFSPVPGWSDKDIETLKKNNN
jgi:hypothetical protein